MTTNSPNPVDGDVQELISDAEAIIELFESAGAINQIAYKLAKIAHASLTAVPKRMRMANGESSRTWVECSSDYHRGTDFYTTPPARLLRPVELPDRYDIGGLVDVEKDDDGSLLLVDDVIELLLSLGYEVK